MQAGDTVVCRGPRGYQFTEGKEYKLLKYEPAEPSSLPSFTWPAYVVVIDDSGRKVCCHADRFVPKDK